MCGMIAIAFPTKVFRKTIVLRFYLKLSFNNLLVFIFSKFLFNIKDKQYELLIRMEKYQILITAFHPLQIKYLTVSIKFFTFLINKI